MDAVGIQAWPLPAAVMLPSAWMLPDMVVYAGSLGVESLLFWLGLLLALLKRKEKAIVQRGDTAKSSKEQRHNDNHSRSIS